MFFWEGPSCRSKLEDVGGLVDASSFEAIVLEALLRERR